VILDFEETFSLFGLVILFWTIVEKTFLAAKKF